jgi:YrbI family 3-deoxy-D-manno-octulosonate 8-phosphate phosphatase
MNTKISKELTEKLSKIKLLVMDVDGTLTDGGVYYSPEGLAMKRFSVYDGMGISLLNQSGIQSMILSSDSSSIPQKRAEKININYILIGAKRKSTALVDFIKTINIKLEEIAFIGDDINDIEVMKMCGFSACPKNAIELAKQNANFISDFCGGEGAVRQLCELLLLSQKKPITIIYE